MIQRLISTEKVLYHGHWMVIPALGISIEGDNLTKLCFYNEYLAPFWENIRRPIYYELVRNQGCGRALIHNPKISKCSDQGVDEVICLFRY